VLYDIKLTISYTYQQAVRNGRQILRLMPLPWTPTQRLISGLLRVDPLPDERLDMTDFFGNAATQIALHHPTDRVAYHLTARVEWTGTSRLLDLSPPFEQLSSELAHERDIGPLSPHHFLGRSERVGPEAAMTEYAWAQVKPGMTTVEAIQAVGSALHRDMRFDAGATDVDTTASEAFSRRHGVCQDFSHVMIACLRGLGIPAGYVSGFLRTLPPPGQERLEGADAMHAWVRAWGGQETGWIEFDPTNNITAGSDHIVVAYGRDYSDLPPVRGSFRAAGSHTTDQAVDMIAL